MSSLVILSVALFEISCEKTDRQMQTDKHRPQLPSAWVTRIYMTTSWSSVLTEPA